jgi:Flp pilus assembly protein TadD
MTPSESSNKRQSTALLAVPVFLVFAVLCAGVWQKHQSAGRDPFVEVMNIGKTHFEMGKPELAIEDFRKAIDLLPTHTDAHLNLANALLLADQPEQAIQAAEQTLQIDPNSPPAWYVKGCSHLRLHQYEPALKALQQCLAFDSNIAAVHFQIGLAQQGLRNWEDAIVCFQATTDFEPQHPAAHYNLSQALIRQDRREEANQELILHQQIAANAASNFSAGAAAFERCAYTKVRVPFQLQQPDHKGTQVQFVDLTGKTFGNTASAKAFRGPIGVMDIKQDGSQDLLVMTQENSFQLLINTNGTFAPLGPALPGIPGARYHRSLVGDLQNDRNEDAIVLGDQGSHVFRFATNGAMTDVSQFSRLNDLAAIDGALVDLDFTGKTDLLAITHTNTVRVFRNLGNLYFKDISATSGVPNTVTTAQSMTLDDWNNDDLMDLFLTRTGSAPLFLVKQRGGPLLATNAIPDLPSGSLLAVGDLNNDLRNDVVVGGTDRLEVFFNGIEKNGTLLLPGSSAGLQQLTLVDYDNDGWLDILGTGTGIKLWRNLGSAGFREVSQDVGLDKITDPIASATVADFDGDGDTDFLLDTGETGLRFLANEGGNSNLQLKLRLVGNRSNASGLGVRVEMTAGGLRQIRTVRQLPIEIGVGNHAKLDSLTVRWFDLAWFELDVQVEQGVIQDKVELNLPTGSCPYLYAWDGTGFRFITDLLSAAPAGLPMIEGVYIEADTDEFVWLGNDSQIKPRGSQYVLQITDELREVLYYDETKLFVVDHPAGTEIFPNDKLLPGKPFPPSQLHTLQNARPVIRAIRSDGLDVTARLQAVDQQMVSPVNLRIPQLRGLAEPFQVTLDFGPLQTNRSLVLGLVGWLHFGGGMANVAASQNPELPFPFPSLEVETAEGTWQPVDVRFGAPAGKTKRVMVDLENLPAGSRRLRISTAFEIHWDQIALYEKGDPTANQVTALAPASANLHWRGFGVYESWPWFLPLTPNYDQVRQNPPWRITPSGWCTRYGDVTELLQKRDDAMVILNGGDEMTLSFAANDLPAKPPGFVRDFFLYDDGWDKDADFHVLEGTTVGPIPFHGMNDQLYGREKRPVIDGDWWIEKYNTRWVGPLSVDREGVRRMAGTAKPGNRQGNP